MKRFGIVIALFVALVTPAAAYLPINTDAEKDANDHGYYTAQLETLFGDVLVVSEPTTLSLMDKVRIYAPINAIAIPCELVAINQADNDAMLAGVESDQDAKRLLGRLHRETQEAYVAARNAGAKGSFCSKFISDNRQYVRPR